MSFNPLMATLVPEGPKTVVELGNQTFRAGVPGIKTTEEFYRSRGYTTYKCIDVNSKYGALMMDINKDLRKVYQFDETFELVTNNGTGEHLFNQYMVFKNIHQLCVVGGLMLHVMPFVNWMNHGFYNFHPILYVDLALANGYDLKGLLLANRWGKATNIKDPVYWREPKQSPAIRDAVRHIQNNDRNEHNVMVVAILKKCHDDEFRMPIQGKYAHDIEDGRIRDDYVAAG